MSQSKQNWAVAQSIDTHQRTIRIEMGIVDSFGGFHPDQDMCHDLQDPKWLTMSQEDFVEAAKLSMELARQEMSQSFA